MAGPSPAMTNKIRLFRTKFRSWPRRSKTSSSSLWRSSTRFVGDIEGNLNIAREARARAAEAGADLSPSPSSSSPAIRSRIWCSSPRLQKAAREACEALARETKDGGPAMLMGLPWGEGAGRLQCRGAARWRPHRGGALQIQSAELRRVRREARVRRRPAAAADRVSRRDARRADLRGYLERGGVRGACCKPAPSC